HRLPSRAGTCAREQHRLCGTTPLVLLGRAAGPAAVAAELPGLDVVGLQRPEDRLELGLDRARLDRRDDLDPVVEVPRQEIGAAEEVALLVVGVEDEEAAVLEEASQDAP